MSDNKPVISDEAVEAAAKAYREPETELGYAKWEDLGEDGQKWRLDRMRAALEAATVLYMGERHRTACDASHVSPQPLQEPVMIEAEIDYLRRQVMKHPGDPSIKPGDMIVWGAKPVEPLDDEAYRALQELPTDEAVEAAAKEAFWTDDHGGHIPGKWTWETIPEKGRQDYRAMVRAVLSAAAPYLKADAWDEGEVAGRGNRMAEEYPSLSTFTNPYRS